MAETEDRVTRIETTLERIFDRLDRIDGGMARLEAQLNTMNTEMARISGRMDQLPGRWTFLVVMLPVSAGLFVGLLGVVLALFRLAAQTP